MSKKSRNFKEGGIYHITHRGHNHQFILADDIDKAIFLDKLKKILSEHSGHLLYYVLMNNHYHILLEMQTTPIDQIMHRLNTGYGRYYSHKHQTSGAVFENRYQAQEVDGLKYLHAVIKYMILNPAQAGLNEKMTEYRLERPSRPCPETPSLRQQSALVRNSGGTPEKGRLVYQELIQSAHKDPKSKLNPREYHSNEKSTSWKPDWPRTFKAFQIQRPSTKSNPENARRQSSKSVRILLEQRAPKDIPSVKSQPCSKSVPQCPVLVHRNG